MIGDPFRFYQMPPLVPVSTYGPVELPMVDIISTRPRNNYGGLLDKIYSTLNPYNWGVEDYSNVGKFSNAYEKAKRFGEVEFMFNGKRYNTKYAGTPRQEVGAYGVNGKPLRSMDRNSPSQVNLYPPFGKYLPGHISASVTSDPESASVDYNSKGNYPYGINRVINKGEKSYYVYGANKDKIYDKVSSLPGGEYSLEEESNPSDWNLFTNNCADNVCDAFGIPRSKGIQTPGGAMSKIKSKYPTLDVTKRTTEDYRILADELNTFSPKDVLPKANYIIGLSQSPDLKGEISRGLISSIQNALWESGYKLPKSTKFDGRTFDGILGKETIDALKDWQSKQ
jgi:hypothetical protein